MFEYMNAGIPVIASNFPLWEKIIHLNKCGLIVNPLDPHEIAQNIDFLYYNRSTAIYMGNRGKRINQKEI